MFFLDGALWTVSGPLHLAWCDGVIRTIQLSLVDLDGRTP